MAAAFELNDEERSKVLSQLSEFLIPSKDYVKNGNELAAEIIKICQGMPKYKICRPTVGGSIGKKTALPDEFEPDFDIILMFNDTLGLDIDPVNDQRPDPKEVTKKYDEIIKSMEDTIRTKLAKNTGLEVLPKPSGGKGKVSSRICLKMQIKKNGRVYSFDILPAHNFHPVVASNENAAELHLKKAINNIVYAFDKEKELFKKIERFYSSAFSEAALDFVKKYSGLANQNIRLAKFWLNHIVRTHIKKDVFGLTFQVELIAIHTVKCEEEKNPKGASGLRVFTQFLLLMKDFAKIDIIFKDNYDRTKIPATILGKKPLVLDPTNPTNNVAALIPEDVAKILSEQAKHTLSQVTDSFDQLAMKIPSLIFRQLFFKQSD
jgi:hypothetical protein